MRYLLFFALLLISMLGCGRAQTPPGDGRPLVKVHGTATDIPVYDPEKHGEPLNAAEMGPGYQDVWEMIDPAEHIEAYKEEHGHYPQDYAEFKSGVMEPNDVKFPENIPAAIDFCYDEKNHRVVLVRKSN